MFLQVVPVEGEQEEDEGVPEEMREDEREE